MHCVVRTGVKTTERSSVKEKSSLFCSSTNGQAIQRSDARSVSTSPGRNSTVY